MATVANRVFVSPGVYTSELDLTFVAQSVGVTTLGLVGETLQGPAFEPVLITSPQQFTTYFGSTSPEKDGNGIVKYQLPYVASSYLKESNQLFVTRVLGLTGYKPYNTFGIVTLSGVIPNTGATPTTTSGTMSQSNVTGSTYYADLSGKTTIDGLTIPAYVSGTTFADGNWFTIGQVPAASLTGLTGVELTSPIGAGIGPNWYNVYFTQTGITDASINGVHAYLFVYSSGSTSFAITQYTYPASGNTMYSNQVIATLKSRGRYVLEQLSLEVSGSTYLTLSSTGVSTNPLADFTINVTGLTGGNKQFTCSLDTTSSKYITKVLGTGVFDKSYVDHPVFVDEVYPNYILDAYRLGYVRGLSTTPIYHLDSTDYLTKWDTTLSPMVVSEVRGGVVHDLFQFITVSDGSAANTQVKITIQNVNMDTGEFDILVRDFNDTDDNIVALESFTRCTMDPNAAGFIGKKIGTADTTYPLNSNYIMLILADNAPSDAFPAGFRGFVTNANFSGGVYGSVIYKTNIFQSGDVMYYNPDGTEVLSNGDKYKKISLGLSSQAGFQFDSDLLQFKGLSAFGQTDGFHLSVNASGITGATTFQTTPYDLEGQTGSYNPLTNINFRKFTLAVCGGFDGWDIYRNIRTNEDQYVFNSKTYTSGITTNGGVFSPTVGNSDYYAYLQGILTFQNPEAVNINVFSTPGINFYDHSGLVLQAIDMVENDRADSLYIIDSPNYGTSEEVVSALNDIGYDSNYSATYWPWIQINDNTNSTQVFIPPTGEVLKNIALTDNVSYPWFASAGYTRGLVTAVKAQTKLTLDDRDLLYKNRINPIATFSDTGTIIWGNKTLQVRESALDRINVRRLLLQARKLISAVAVRLLFEQNDDVVRNEFLRLVNPILENIKKERGLYQYAVTVSSDPADIDANTMRGKIYVQPTRSLEFIDLEFIVTPTGASFQNI
jgi:Phage tail sheath protein subtilisin-like domain